MIGEPAEAKRVRLERRDFPGEPDAAGQPDAIQPVMRAQIPTAPSPNVSKCKHRGLQGWFMRATPIGRPWEKRPPRALRDSAKDLDWQPRQPGTDQHATDGAVEGAIHAEPTRAAIFSSG